MGKGSGRWAPRPGLEAAPDPEDWWWWSLGSERGRNRAWGWAGAAGDAGAPGVTMATRGRPGAPVPALG